MPDQYSFNGPGAGEHGFVLRPGKESPAARLARYGLLLESSQNIVLEWDTDGQVLFLNSWGLDFFGFTAEEIIGRNVVGTIVAASDESGEDLNVKMAWIRRIPDEFSSNENENIRKTGERVWINWTNYPVKDANGRLISILSVGMDRTSQHGTELEIAARSARQEARLAESMAELERAKEELLASEARLKTAFTTGTDGWLIASLEDPKLLDVNDRFLRMFGYAREEVVGRTTAELMLWANPEERQKLLADLRRTGSGVAEAMARRKDGTTFRAAYRATTIDGINPPLVVGTVRDMTEEKLSTENLQKVLRLEAAMTELLSRFIALPDSELNKELFDFQQKVCGILSLDASMLYIPRHGEGVADLVSSYRREAGAAFPTPLMHDEFPWCENEVYSGRTVRVDDTAKPPSGAERDRDAWKRYGIKSSLVIPLRGKGERVIGTIVFVMTSAAYAWSDDIVDRLTLVAQVFMATIARREAERERLSSQAELYQARKLESIGRLAGGVAHDFNNLLTAITGYGTMLLRSLSESDPHRSDVEDILGAANRGAELAKQLLAFGRKQELRMKVLDLNMVVRDAHSLLKRLIGENIKLETHLLEVPCRILADSGQMGQVIMNLAVNARDAMPGGGTITISTRLRTMPDTFYKSNPDIKRGELVELRVRDTGSGMTEEVKKHVFEPFFTTKEQGKGTGLGLSMVYGIVRQSGGVVLIESEPGKGTEFALYFPIATEPVTVHPAAAAGAGGPGMATGLILLVEDDAMLRRLSGRVLREAGYTVITAEGGLKALAELESRGKVDVLITDVVMPGMSGAELAAEARRRGLARAVLFVSGYVDETLQGQGIDTSGGNFLLKPYTPDTLVHKLDAIIGANRK